MHKSGKKLGYGQLVSLAAKQPVPPKTFVVTFDDGYDSVYRNAWPILKELSVPATVFLVTGWLDAERPFYSDDWVAAGSADVPATAWKPLSTAGRIRAPSTT